MLFRSEDPNDPFAKLDPRQADQVMRELESTVNRMDEHNPDPRQMGALMRKMCDMTGEKMDGAMEEVVRKLEEGTDPQEIEERMGDLMDGSSEEQLDNPENDGRNTIPRPRRLVRDPELYDLEDFLPER